MIPEGDRQTPMPRPEYWPLLHEGVPFARHARDRHGVLRTCGFALLRTHHHQRAPGSPTRTRSRATAPPTARHGSLRFLRRRGAPRSAECVGLPLGRRRLAPSSRRSRTVPSAPWAASRPARTTTPDGWRYLLSAWPPPGMPRTPARRNARPCANLRRDPTFRACERAPGAPGAACRQAATYGMGLWVAVDCDLGLTLSHGGGYPGYGSHVLLLPDHGAALFAFANRTYAGPSVPVCDAAIVLGNAGLLPRAHHRGRARNSRASISHRRYDLPGRARSQWLQTSWR